MKATLIAIGVQVAIMAIIPIQPLLVRATGTTVYLETEKMDPQSLFRGHYAILGYQVAQNIVPEDMAKASHDTGRPVYVTVTTERPGRFVAVSLDPPQLSEGQACIVGRVRGWGNWSPDDDGEAESVDFPQIAQYFAPKEEAQLVETERGDNLLAKVKTTGSCNAQLVGLEAR